ncbi:MAG: twin-arginine translocation signal domain-containing protein, partial [Anaerolineae bacterium]
MFTRRQFLKFAATATVALAMPIKFGSQRAAAAPLLLETPQVPLPSDAIPQFVDPVPDLLDGEHLIVDDGTPFELQMREHVAQILPAGAIPGYAGTHVWSYLKPDQETRTSYLGPVVLATRNVPTEIQFTNQLGNTSDTQVLAYKHSTDQTLHWADPLDDEA